MEKKKKTEKEKPDEKAAKKAPAAKAAAKKPAAKGASKKGKADKEKEEDAGIRRTAAEVRSQQEEGSIAPASSRLVSAFSAFKTARRTVSGAPPVVTRLAPGSALPKPPAPPAPKPPESVKPPESAPVAQAPAAAPAPAPAAPKPAVPAPQPQAKPAAPAAPAAPKPATPASPSAPRPAGSVPPRPATPPSTPPRPGAPSGPQRPGSGPYRPGQPPYRPGPQHHRPGGHRPGGAKPSHRQGHQKSPEPAAASAPGAKAPLRSIEVSTMVTVRELAEKMEVKPNDLIKKLIGLGVFATINQRLETEAASIVAAEFGYELKVVAMYKEEELEIKAAAEEKPEKLKTRSPVVTIMGHVDHGKTSLLDAIRSANVAGGESGGITQHIGAYKVMGPKGEIVFLDTPGHAAFTAMRARGAKVTDLVVLVVSATDGVMPQTVEAIDHAKAAGVPILVAVNKIDLPDANPQKIRQELSSHGLLSEEWGGKTIYVEVSAKKRLNLDKLLEMILLQSEILELKANPDRPGHGVILEAKMDPKRGNVATLLVQAGTVRVGEAFVAGLSYGRVKALLDDKGGRIQEAGPSTPVEVLGLMGTPQAGDVFSIVSDDRQARDIAEKRGLLHREQAFAHQRHMSLVGLKSQGAGPAAKDLNIILKADTQGSLQAIKDSLENLSTSECRVRIIHAGIGNANESDVLLATASDAVTLLFHTEAETRATELAERSGLELRRYEIIYELIGDVKAALEGLLAPEIVDVIVGKGEIREVFAVKAGAKVAGCFIREGKVVRGGLVKVMRGARVAHEGKISSLKRFKDDVKEVEKNLECGLSIDGFNDYQKGDQLEFFVKETRTRRLDQSAK